MSFCYVMRRVLLLAIFLMRHVMQMIFCFPKSVPLYTDWIISSETIPVSYNGIFERNDILNYLNTWLNANRRKGNVYVKITHNIWLQQLDDFFSFWCNRKYFRVICLFRLCWNNPIDAVDSRFQILPGTLQSFRNYYVFLICRVRQGCLLYLSYSSFYWELGYAENYIKQKKWNPMDTT